MKMVQGTKISEVTFLRFKPHHQSSPKNQHLARKQNALWMNDLIFADTPTRGMEAHVAALTVAAV